ncbi:reverse transcriptase zinc-binding domain-containing protein, partial [Tanacetum coccineum]
MIVNGRWSWLEEWSNKFPLITSLEVPSIEEEREDKIVWKTRFGQEVEFSMRQVNIDFTIQNPKVPWWKLVWYSQCIPKQSFILWLAIQDRLTTQDKLRRWGNQAVNRCCLCLNDLEDLKHLFFQCPFSKAVWRKVLTMTEIKVFEYEWKEVIQTLIQAGTGNSINSVVRRLIFAASVYNIWVERNRRIFQDKKMTDDEVFKRIIGVVKSKLTGLTVRNSSAVQKMEDKWKISCKRLPIKIADKTILHNMYHKEGLFTGEGIWLGWTEYVGWSRGFYISLGPSNTLSKE